MPVPHRLSSAQDLALALGPVPQPITHSQGLDYGQEYHLQQQNRNPHEESSGRQDNDVALARSNTTVREDSIYD